MGQGGLHLANFGFIKIVGGRRVNYGLRMLKINLSQLPSPDKGTFLIGKMKCKKPFDLEKSERGILKSGCANKYAFQKFWGEGRG